MPINICAAWKNQTPAEREAQRQANRLTTEGRIGCLSEFFHGTPYVTKFFCPEAFEDEDGAFIPTALLRARLPFALRLVEERERNLYRSSDEQIENVKQSYRDFVRL